MNLDRKLNLVITLDRGDAPAVMVVSSPVAEPVFRLYYRVLAKTFAQICLDRVDMVGGPRIACMALEDVAHNTPRGQIGDTWWDGADGVENGLLPEIWRLTNVLAPEPDGGWAAISLADAIKRPNLLSPDEVTDIQGTVVFFIVSWLMHRPRIRELMLTASGAMWGWEISSSSFTELRASLATSTKPDPSGPKARASATLR